MLVARLRAAVVVAAATVAARGCPPAGSSGAGDGAPPAPPGFPVPPFSRPLAVTTPPTAGLDVYILQNLLRHNGGASGVNVSSTYDAATAAAVAAAQTAAGLPPTGAVDAATAAAILSAMSDDGYVDDGAPPAASGHLYKVHIRVPANRSVEVPATLAGPDGAALLSFVVRTHGADQYPPGPWPTWNSSGPGLNQFSPDGATPTGLVEFDLNSPEDNATEFGPYPINRAVKGVAGNWAWIATNDATTTVRDGILLHTGAWGAAAGWAPPAPMPNSLGCIHAWPDAVADAWRVLTDVLGVAVRNNTDGTLPYPYKPQGLLSIELARGD
jgi:hypothetical protein